MIIAGGLLLIIAGVSVVIGIAIGWAFLRNKEAGPDDPFT